MQTKRSTNGGCIIVDDICLKAWSTTAKSRGFGAAARPNITRQSREQARASVFWQGALTLEFGPTVWYRSGC